MSCVTEALKYNLSDPISLLAYGMILKATNKLPKAIQILKKAVKADPSCITAKQHLSVALSDWGTHLKVSGRIQDGLKLYRKALKYAENYAPAHYNIGVVYSELHEFTEVPTFPDTFSHMINPKFFI